MTTIHVQLDDATYEKARRAAEARGRSMEEMVAELLRNEQDTSSNDQVPFSGWLADEPELADLVEEEAMRLREQRRLE